MSLLNTEELNLEYVSFKRPSHADCCWGYKRMGLGYLLVFHWLVWKLPPVPVVGGRFVEAPASHCSELHLKETIAAGCFLSGQPSWKAVLVLLMCHRTRLDVKSKLRFIISVYLGLCNSSLSKHAWLLLSAATLSHASAMKSWVMSLFLAVSLRHFLRLHLAWLQTEASWWVLRWFGDLILHLPSSLTKEDVLSTGLLSMYGN